MILRWLTARDYNRFDVFWIVFFALAWRDGHYFAAFVAVVFGAIASGSLEVWSERRSGGRP